MEWLKARIQVNGVISLLAGLLVYGAGNMIGLTANHEWTTLGIILLTSMLHGGGDSSGNVEH